MNARGFSPAEFADATGIGINTTRQILNTLEVVGLAKKSDSGTWSIRQMRDFTKEDLKLLAEKAKERISGNHSNQDH